MPQFDFDLFTLGAGSGGVAATRRAGGYGARVAICEERRVGGTCVLRGCVPKKLLVYAAGFASEFADAAGFGWTVGERRLDWADLIARKNRELDRLAEVYQRMLRDANATILQGRGRVLDPHTVQVADRRYTAKHVLVATGGWPERPAIPGIEHAITSNEALESTRLPHRLVIVGAGYVGLEFASIFASAGVDVTVIARSDGPLRGFDQDVRTAVRAEMEKRAVRFVCPATVNGIERHGESLTVDLRGHAVIETDQVLYAVGRRPNTTGIGLEEVGVELRGDGAIVVDEWSRTAVESIFAIGDVTNRVNLTPVAIAEGRAMAETLFNHNPTRLDHENTPTAVFAQPPVACVGLTEGEARDRFAHVDIYRTEFRPMKHTLSGRDARSMVKLVVDRDTDRVLGCHMVGEDAAEIIQGLGIALRCGATKKQFDATIGIHPTAAEEFVTMRAPVRARPQV